MKDLGVSYFSKWIGAKRRPLPLLGKWTKNDENNGKCMYKQSQKFLCNNEKYWKSKLFCFTHY